MRKIPITVPYFTQDEKLAVMKTLDSGWVAQGPAVAEFETAVAQHEGVLYAIATTSCTTALHLAMVASGVHEGMDILVPSFTFVATANAVRMAGADPVLVDIAPDTYNLDPEFVTTKIERNYVKSNGVLVNNANGNILWGIVVVHQFGLCADMESFKQLATKYNLTIIEDAACAIGARIGDTHEGAFGNTSCLSFHPRKSITTGEGGMILTDDPKLAETVRRLRSHSASVSVVQRHVGNGFLLPEYNELGYNYRMNDIQASIGLAQLNKLDEIIENKIKLAEHYNELIQVELPFLITPHVPKGYYHTYQSYVCMIDRDRIERILGTAAIEEIGEYRNEMLSIMETLGVASRQGTHAIHLLGYYRERYGYKPDDLPVSYACDRLSISLPLYKQMSVGDQIYVVEAISQAHERAIRKIIGMRS